MHTAQYTTERVTLSAQSCQPRHSGNEMPGGHGGLPQFKMVASGLRRGHAYAAILAVKLAKSWHRNAMRAGQLRHCIADMAVSHALQVLTARMDQTVLFVPIRIA